MGGRRRFGVLIATLTLLLGLAACVPWTVRPIQDDSAQSGTGAAARGPAEYVDSIWSTKLVPAVLSSAQDARAVIDSAAASAGSTGQKYFTIKGSGRVVKVDTGSRNGLLLVDLAPFDGKADLSIQIGPVIRGSALRDATGLIRFNDFANQIAFADANNAVNDHVLKSVLAGLDTAGWKGHTVEFAGAFEPGSGVIPVELKDDGVAR